MHGHCSSPPGPRLFDEVCSSAVAVVEACAGLEGDAAVPCCAGRCLHDLRKALGPLQQRGAHPLVAYLHNSVLKRHVSFQRFSEGPGGYSLALQRRHLNRLLACLNQQPDRQRALFAREREGGSHAWDHTRSMGQPMFKSMKSSARLSSCMHAQINVSCTQDCCVQHTERPTGKRTHKESHPEFAILNTVFAVVLAVWHVRVRTAHSMQCMRWLTT
jgi:hypothetical protein